MSEQIKKSIEELRQGNVRFARLLTICTRHFGQPRISGSHHIFSTPWPGQPRVNIQPGKGGRSKAYQVRQVIRALEKLLETKT